jgi:hypothetical protein
MMPGPLTGSLRSRRRYRREHVPVDPAYYQLAAPALALTRSEPCGKLPAPAGRVG